MWVFAYGSNMDEDHLRDWFQRKNIAWNIIRSVRAELPDHKLVWNYRRTSEDAGTGASNVDHVPGNVLWGVAIEVPNLNAMNRKEGYKPSRLAESNYLKKDCLIRIDGFAHPTTAAVYYAQFPETGFVSPLQKYKNYLLKGSRKFDLPSEHIQEIEGVMSREQEIAINSFYKWERREFKHGEDVKDWLSTEAELKIPR